MKDNSFTEQERACGVVKTVSVEVSPTEYDLLDAFRALNSTVQDIIIQLIQAMSNNSNVNS